MNLVPSHPGKTPHRVLVQLDPEPRAIQNRQPPVPDDQRLGDDILGPYDRPDEVAADQLRNGTEPASTSR
jgi:hypothetical protein